MLDVALFTGDEQIAAKVQRALSFTSAKVERMTWQSRLSSSVMARPRDLIVLHPKHLTREQRYDLECIVQMRQTTPCIALVADPHAEDAVYLLDAGVDRFLVEPFDEQHFAALVRALMRRRQGHVSSVTQYGPLIFDHGLKQLHVNGLPVNLTTREAQVMDVLLRRVGQIISKEEFVQEIAPDNMSLSSSAIEVYMHRIRKKVSAEVLPVRSIKRCGYFLRRFSA